MNALHMAKLLSLLPGLRFQSRGKSAALRDVCSHVGLLQSRRPRIFPISLLASCFSLVFLLGLHMWTQCRSRYVEESISAALMRTENRLQSEFHTEPLTNKLRDAIPTAIDRSASLVAIQSLAAANSIVLLRVASSEEAGVQRKSGLHKYVFDLSLSGSYLDLKNFLAQLLVESPELWLARLQLQAEGSTVVASVSLHAWSADDMKAAPQTRPLVTP